MPRSRELRRLVTIAVVVGMSVASCTILLDADAVQCRGDADCARFNARCNLRAGLCARPAAVVLLDGGVDAARGDAADGPRDVGIEVPATWGYPAMCRIFDNRARLFNLEADGGLKPLP